MKKTISEDDEKVWKHVTSSVKAYTPKKKPAKPELKKAIPVKAASPKAAPSRIKHPETPVITVKRAIAANPVTKQAGFDKSTETKLRKGQLDIEGRIDLHGMTQDEAHRALTGFITRAVKAGKRTLLVITGKGKVTTGGVLRRMVPLWLEGHSSILAITSAAIKDGGSGAYYIRLRKPK